MSITRKKTLEPQWHIIDASTKPVGRIATEVATLLRGKHKTEYVPYLDCGDHVVIVNASQSVFTGKKMQHKKYFHYSGFHGGMKEHTAEEYQEKTPDKILHFAVKGMLPKNKMQDTWLKRLHIYATSEHPHVANVSLPDNNVTQN